MLTSQLNVIIQIGTFLSEGDQLVQVENISQMFLKVPT
jgi:hypothetical protein